MANAFKPHYKKCYIARLDILYTESQDSFGGLDQSPKLFRQPSLKACEKMFSKQMKTRKLNPGEIFTMDIQVYEYCIEDGELGELIEIIDLKEYR